jgi:hypothetical protein
MRNLKQRAREAADFLLDPRTLRRAGAFIVARGRPEQMANGYTATLTLGILIVSPARHLGLAPISIGGAIYLELFLIFPAVAVSRRERYRLTGCLLGLAPSCLITHGWHWAAAGCIPATLVIVIVYLKASERYEQGSTVPTSFRPTDPSRLPRPPAPVRIEDLPEIEEPEIEEKPDSLICSECGTTDPVGRGWKADHDTAGSLIFYCPRCSTTRV